MRFALAMLLFAGLAGCSDATPARTTGSGQAIVLTASLISPTGIVLTWRDDGPTAAGYVVEFATEPGGPYTILRYLPEPERTYQHRDLIPHTRFSYRVRPFYGPVSAATGITAATPDPPSAGEGTCSVRAGHATVCASTGHATCSIRGGDAGVHPESCAPAGLTAASVAADTVEFSWSDRACDEQGFLLEVMTGHAGFAPMAVFDPDVDEASLIVLPGERDGSFRVRAFYYGAPSKPVHQTTGAATS